jgi:hypothetical protein
LSIFSRDQQHDPSDIHSGGRAIKGFCRPFVHAAAGTLTRVHFNHTRGTFSVTLTVDPVITAPTLIYAPDIWYGAGVEIDVTSGSASVTPDRDGQIIAWHGGAAGTQTLTLRIAKG